MLQIPDSFNKDIVSFLVVGVSKLIGCFSFEQSISKEINLLFSPLLIADITPHVGDVINIPGFFLSSITFYPVLTSSPSLTNIVGFKPI